MDLAISLAVAGVAIYYLIKLERRDLKDYDKLN